MKFEFRLPVLVPVSDGMIFADTKTVYYSFKVTGFFLFFNNGAQFDKLVAHLSG